MSRLKAFLGTFLFVTTLFLMPAMVFADTYYTVKPGDSLWKIANSTGVSVEQIKKLNSLNSDMIHPGQSLIVSKGNVQSGAERPAPQVSRGTSRVDDIIDYAKTFIGVPYRSGGQSPKGFDCSGYVQYVFKNFGMKLPHNAGEQFYMGTRIKNDEAKPGDIVAFKAGKAISHNGIYIGGDRFIHSSSSRGVMISSIHDTYWAKRFLGYSRILP
ncbi:MAG: NlpC/P60 family protein [Bacillota bacterium]